METEQHYLGDLIAERKGYFIYRTTDPNMLKLGENFYFKRNKSDEKYIPGCSFQDVENQIDEIESIFS